VAAETVIALAVGFGGAPLAERGDEALAALATLGWRRVEPVAPPARAI